jgi:hypothetical protein
MRLLHIIKMIFNVSSFYNSSERVASLLVKITNQVCCCGNLHRNLFCRIHSIFPATKPQYFLSV